MGETALILSSRNSTKISSENTVKMLLNDSKIDPNLQNKYGWTALQYASTESNRNSTENTVMMLLRHPKVKLIYKILWVILH